MERFLEDIKKHDSAPFLFLGSGFSRRYIGSPKWEELLEESASWVGKNFKQYVSKVKDGNKDDPMFLPYIAKMIAEDFESVWWESEDYGEIRKKTESDVTNYASPLKIATAEYIKKFSLLSDNDKIASEISALKRLSEKNSIDGVITTNWDCLAEEIFGFERFIGQEQLLFSNVLNVGEIFKIHGCVTEPNSIVFDSNDYDLFNKRNHYLASKLTTIFIEHPIVFIGYSIRDKNIRDILNAIIYGIGVENLKKFGKKIFFLEYNFENDEFIYTTMPIALSHGTIEMTYIKTNNFVGIFDVLGKNERKFSAKLVRQMKSHLFELLLTDDPKEQIFVTTDLENSLERVQFVYGAGVIEKLSNAGYEVIKNDALLKDIIGINDARYDYEEIVKRTLLTPNKNHVPVNYFIFKSGLLESELDQKIIKRRITKYEQIYKGGLDKTSFNERYNNLSDLISDESNIPKLIEKIAYLYPNKIDNQKLKEIIIENINLLDDGNPVQKTNIRRLIKYFDWLEYGNR